VRALIAGGVDLLLVETIFDSLNAKAALVAIREVFDEDGKELPVMISAAVGRGGETLISAQTTEAFWNAVQHVKPLSVGLNCSLGPDLMYPFLEELSEKADVAISCYPNAGCPTRSPRPASIWARPTWPATWATSPGRADQHRRRLLRQHPGAHRGHRQSARRQSLRALWESSTPHPREPPRERSREGAQAAPSLRLAALHPAARRLHHDRRAHQRRRLAQSSPSWSRKANTKKR
jgi:hypothetical protein